MEAQRLQQYGAGQAGSPAREGQRFQPQQQQQFYQQGGGSSIAPAAQPYALAGSPAASVSPEAVAAAMQLLLSQGMAVQPQQQSQQQQRAGLRFPDGSTYVGDIANGKPHGNGVLTYSGSDEKGRLKYDGGFQNGEKSGRGHQIWRDGSEYIGEWAKDTMNGKGKYTYASTSERATDEGDFQDGKLHGQGTRLGRDKSKYVGAFVNNAREGEGIFTQGSTGDTFEGVWKDSNLFNGTRYYYSQSGRHVRARFVNGKSLPPEEPCCIIL